MAKLPGANQFFIREPHLVGKEVFGPQKRKAGVPLGFKSESHQPDKVNFSRPQIATRSARANHASCNLSDVVEEFSPDLQEDQASNNLSTMVDVRRPGYVTAIQETTCKETEWHIARLSKTSSKACFVQQVVTKKKCTTKIVQDNRSIVAPTYTRVMVHIKRNKEERMQFFFYNDDIEWCMKGTRWKWI
jgi:uncharacterized UPF0160 family protein